MSRKLSKEDIEDRLISTGIELTGEYKDTHSKTEFKCFCGKKFITNAHDILLEHTKSCGCLQIKWAKIHIVELYSKYKGKNHCRYNPLLTDEDRLNKRKTPEDNIWTKRIFERDNYTCNICNQYGNVNAHHLNGYHWCPEGRLDINNGITLCKDCHVDFHYIYGIKWNTKEQFIEYLKENI